MASLAYYLQIIVYSMVVLCASYMAFTISKRERTTLSTTLITFFIFVAAGSTLSAIARLINDLDIKDVLIILVPIVLGLSIPQLMFFLLIILQGSISYSTGKQIVIILGYLGLELILFLIPNGSTFIMDEGGSMQPAWSLEFIIYGAVVHQVLFIYDLYLVVKIIHTLEDKEAKKRFQSIILAILIFDYILLGTFVVNYLNLALVRMIFSITGLLVFLALYLLYNGLGKQLSKKSEA